MADSVKDVMTPEPITLTGSSTAADAARVMRDSDIGDVLVARDDGTLGILTDRDLAIRVVAEGLDPARTPIDGHCSSDVVTVSPDDTVSHVVRLMRDRAIRRMPVISDGTVAGIVSMGDLAVQRDPESALAEVSAAPANH